jgi:hypothetical protein
MVRWAPNGRLKQTEGITVFFSQGLKNSFRSDPPIRMLDNKPDFRGKVINQLQLHAKCQKKRIGLSIITCAYFDENGYYQLTPVL